MSDKTKGLYQKFIVTRTDGSSEPGRKHKGCEYFVLDLSHDPFAVDAVEAYARACESDYPELSKDLLKKVACKCGHKRDSHGGKYGWCGAAKCRCTKFVQALAKEKP